MPDEDDPLMSEAPTVLKGRAVDLAGAGAEPPKRGAPARRMGRYLVGDEIGRGGMGIVYKAFDPDLRRPVALKLIRRELSSLPGIYERFAAEAQVTAQLQHPAVVPVYDVGRTFDGEIYYAMKFVRGRTLSAVAKEPRELTPFRLLETFVQVCHAVAYAHERGVVHRDLKPQNVMLGRFGEVHVMDWGLAKVAGSEERAAGTAAPSPRHDEGAVTVAVREGATHASVLGSPGFMAPEQVESPGTVGPAADVWALGAMLYYLLTGGPPFVGTKETILSRTLVGPAPEAPRSVNPRIAPALERHCLRALAREPSERFASAVELAEAVEAHLEGRVAEPRPEDRDFLKTYDADAYRRPSVTIDVILFARSPGRTRVLLRHRNAPPFQGYYGLPGRFLALEESLEEAAARALRERAGIEGVALAQLGAFGDPARDPRTRVITVVFTGVIETADPPRPTSPELSWVDVELRDGAPVLRLEAPGDRPPELAFDHARILGDAMRARAIAT